MNKNKQSHLGEPGDPISIGALNASCQTNADDNAFLERAVCRMPKPTSHNYEGWPRTTEPRIDCPLDFN